MYKSPTMQEIESFTKAKEEEIVVFKIEKLQTLFNSLQDGEKLNFNVLFGDVNKIKKEDRRLMASNRNLSAW